MKTRPLEVITINLKALIFLVAIAYGCNKTSNEGRIIINGTITAPRTNKVYFYSYPDTLALYSETKVPVDSAAIYANGRFSLNIRASRPMTFNLNDGKMELATNLFACPGDRIDVNFTEKGATQFKTNTDAGKFNFYLIAFADKFYKDSLIKQEYYISTNYMDGHGFAMYNDKRKKDQMDFFENFYKDETLRKEYKDYAMNTIQYGIAVDRLMYVWKKRMKSEKINLDSNYFDFETPAFLENSTAYSTPSYIRFLNLYIKDIYERMVGQGEIVAATGNFLNPSVEKYKLANKLLSRPYRDIVLYYVIRTDMNDVSNAGTSQANLSIPVDSLIKWFNVKHSISTTP